MDFKLHLKASHLKSTLIKPKSLHKFNQYKKEKKKLSFHTVFKLFKIKIKSQILLFKFFYPNEPSENLMVAFKIEQGNFVK